jgi:hypothetical protein
MNIGPASSINSSSNYSAAREVKVSAAAAISQFSVGQGISLRKVSGGNILSIKAVMKTDCHCLPTGNGDFISSDVKTGDLGVS